MLSRQHYNVCILGGGLAGLSLGIQLKRARPETSILLIEKNKHPVPEAAYKVGESTVEAAAEYYGNVLGMKEHLETEQIIKPGLRFFFPAGNNNDIARRVEVGVTRLPKYVAYQLDRGRFENALGVENIRLGVDFVDDCKVCNVTLNESHEHCVTFLHQNNKVTIFADWIVDATGRAGLLRRQLGLTKKVDHDSNAVWFRIGQKIDIDRWSQDSKWRSRLPQGFRWQETNHLMGPGYWVWLIPLASGSTSIGIVSDPKLHPFDEMNRFNRALQWLKGHEPQCAKVIEEKQRYLQDFRVLKHYAYGCKQVFSSHRWALTGEAGVFTDPFYSPGSDFIAVSNTMITELILRDFRGEEIAEAAAVYNWYYLDYLFSGTLSTYQGLYPIWGNAQVMTAKIVYDYAIGWGIDEYLYCQEKICDLAFLSKMKSALVRSKKLFTLMQSFFKEWGQQDQQEWTDRIVDLQAIEHLYNLHCGLKEVLSEDELRIQVAKNIALTELMAAKLVYEASQRISLSPTIRDTLRDIFSEHQRAKQPIIDFGAISTEVGVELDRQLRNIWYTGTRKLDRSMR